MKLLLVFLALGLFTALGSPAAAMVLGLDWGTGSSPAHIKYLGHDHNVYAGSLRAYVGGTLGAPLPPNDGSYLADVFCVDLDHWISVPSEYEVDVLTTGALAHGARAAWLYNNFVGGSKGNNGLAAALQLALWDVVCDNGDGLSTGNFRYVGGLATSVSGTATTLISASSGQISTASYFHARGNGQSMIGPPPPVPEPASLSLVGFGLGLVGLGFARRRRCVR